MKDGNSMNSELGASYVADAPRNGFYAIADAATL